MAEGNAQLKAVTALYLHVPFCRHLCNYCDFYKRIPESEQDYTSYEKLLQESLAAQDELFGLEGYGWQPLETLYIGGGTPSLWGQRGAFVLENMLLENKIELSQDIEFTLEVNPGAWDEAGLKAWQSLGVNRFSLGIQSLDSYFLKVLDRVHSLEDVHETLAKFNQLQANFSVDFMLGLPFSETGKRDVIAELKKILEYNPSHISLYILTTKKHYIHAENLPIDEWIESEFMQVSEFLSERGFDHYEVSNFSLPGKESKHNMRYWDSVTTAAVGPSATGFLSEKNLRYKWKTSAAEFVREDLTEEQFQLEKLYMGLRTYRGVDLEQYFAADLVAPILKSWQESGYLLQEKPHVLLSPKGYLMLDSLMDDLFKL